jgi:hypothetical protein
MKNTAANSIVIAILAIISSCQPASVLARKASIRPASSAGSSVYPTRSTPTTTGERVGCVT